MEVRAEGKERLKQPAEKEQREQRVIILHLTVYL